MDFKGQECQECSRVFFGYENFGKYFFGPLDLSRDFLGTQDNLKFHDSYIV